MSVIAYYHGNSFIHRLDPRVKIILLFLLTLLVFITQNFLVIGTILAVNFIFWLYAKLPLRVLLSYLRFLFSLSLFIVIMQGIFYRGQAVLLQPLIPDFIPLIGGVGKVTLEGISFGLLLSLRMFTLICLMPVVTMTTPIHLFALGLVKLGLPYKIAYMATTALNLVPTLQKEIGSIVEAQKLRGLMVFEGGSLFAKLKAYPALVVPLVIGAMRKAQLMGVAMDSRAFGVSATRTYLEDIKMSRLDWIGFGLGVIYLVLLTGLAIYQ